MRVIAGTAGGIPLTTPKTGLRPTMDKVKGAIFSSLAESIPGAKVADFFAGSGGLGIEALSRGAASAVFVESDERAARTLAGNLERARLHGAIVRADVFRYLTRAQGPFDLIFADPPYHSTDKPVWQKLIEHPAVPQLLAPEGLLILEHPLRALGSGNELWNVLRTRDYGKSAVSFLRPASSIVSNQ